MHTKPIVVIVDDDPDDRELLAEVFNTALTGIQVYTLVSANSLIDELDSLKIDSGPTLFVIDYNMPDMTGPELIALLRRDKKVGQAPMIIWSTSDELSYQKISIDHGADYYIKKPNSYAGYVDIAKRMLVLAEIELEK